MKTPKTRPATTGDLVGVGVRVQPDMAKRLDDWRRKQDDIPGRLEVIRRLVELGLKVRNAHWINSPRSTQPFIGRAISAGEVLQATAGCFACHGNDLQNIWRGTARRADGRTAGGLRGQFDVGVLTAVVGEVLHAPPDFRLA